MANSFGDFNGDGRSNYVDYKIFTTQVDPGSGEYQGVNSSNRNYGGSIGYSFGSFINDLPYAPFVAVFIVIVSAIAIYFNLDSLFASIFFFQFILLMIVLLVRIANRTENIDDKTKTTLMVILRNNTIRIVALIISVILFFIVAVIYREEEFGGKNFLKCVSLLISIDSCIALLLCVSERKTILKAITDNNIDVIDVQIEQNENINMTTSSENSTTRPSEDI